MASNAPRLARLFTPTYARMVNAQIVYPAESQVAKPNELQSALARPLHVSVYEPNKSATYLAASLSYGLIKGHPFLDGNKRTAFFIANEYLRAQGLPGLADQSKAEKTYEDLVTMAERHIGVAAGKLELDDLISEQASQNESKW